MAEKPQPDPLARYWAKRNFAVTSEPRGSVDASGSSLAFVIQKHHASRLHYDFRLELDGVMLSWAVPKGPSVDPKDMRMAIHVEDHPLSYNSFEGTIPPKQYGAGTVIVWDNGTWEPTVDPQQGLKDGKLVFTLHGHKLVGLWELVRIAKPGDKQEAWLLFKKRDRHARPRSRIRRGQRAARQRDRQAAESDDDEQRRPDGRGQGADAEDIGARNSPAWPAPRRPRARGLTRSSSTATG